MLNRRSLGVAGGTALLGTMALVATHTADAVIVAGGTGTHADVKIAREGLVDTAAFTHTVDSVKYYHINNANESLDIQAVTGISPSSSSPVHLRFQLENMIFGSAISGATAGGGEGDDFAVLGYTAGAASSARTLAPGTLGVLPDKAGSVTVTAHVSVLDALRGTNAIGKEQRAGSAVTVVDGLEEKGESGMAVAEVADGFAKFTGSGSARTSARIGTLTVRVAASVKDPGLGDVTTLNQLLGAGTAPITVTYKGDFSEHAYTLNSVVTCAAGSAVASSVNSAGTELTPSAQPDGGAAVTTHHLCVRVAADNEKPITTAPFTATVRYDAIDDAAFPRAEQTVEVGRIERNGRSIHIPYLTTHASYRQRVVIVNRGRNTTYFFGGFQAEGDAKPVAGDMASGVLPTGQTVLRSTGIVGGATRAAATLSIVAPPSTISAAVQQVNLSDGSVDTVYLDGGGM